MCTVSIFRSGSGFTVTMNRDEAFVRAPERRPEIRASVNGFDWAAPFDGEKGGTWMGVNSFGVAACLLNAYQPGESLLPNPADAHRTRGEIIPALLEAGDGPSAQEWIETRLVPTNYQSFTLLLITPQISRSYEWLNRGAMAATALPNPWALRSSSGWDSADVIRWRDERFAQWLHGGATYTDALPSFHLLQEPGHAERSPLMRREWSGTRSITQVRVDTGRRRADLLYWPAPTPDTRAPAAHTSLPLSGSAVASAA